MRRIAYLAMDLVNDLIHGSGPNGGGLGAEAARRNVVANTQAALEKARAANALVIFVRVGFNSAASYADCSKVSPLFSAIANYGLLKLNSWGTELHEGLSRRDGELDIVKHRISPFYATHLEAVLRANAVEQLVLSGVSTNYVVSSAARDAHDRDYQVTILEDCCSAESEAEHRHAIKSVRSLCRSVTTVGAFNFGNQ